MGIDFKYFDTKISEHFKCSICFNIAFPPVKTKCDHLFCQSCLSEWIRTKNTCPIDRSELPTDLVVDKFIYRVINEYTVKCTNFEAGCKWTGCLENQEKHVKEECLYTIVGCKNNNCDYQCVRQELEKH